MDLAGIHQPSFARSALALRGPLSTLVGLGEQGIPTTAIASTEASYRELTARATAAWWKALRLSFADAEFWRIRDMGRFGNCLAPIRAGARSATVWVPPSEDFREIPGGLPASGRPTGATPVPVRTTTAQPICGSA